MVKFVNLTPHVINVLREDGTLWNINPDGTVARLATSQETTEVSSEDGLLAIVKTVFGKIEGLPAPVPGVLWITSTLIAQAAAANGRKDVVSPDTGPSAIRENGQVKAVIRFQRF